MRDSDTYLAIIEEGREEEAKCVIPRREKKCFGAPEASVTAWLTAVTDPDRLHRVEDRMLDATSWQDLLDTPSLRPGRPGPAPGRRPPPPAPPSRGRAPS